MKIYEDYSNKISNISKSKSIIFSDLVSISGLNPETDFIEARLQSVDFEGSNLENFDFREADLRGAKWGGLISAPANISHALRGGGEDNVNGSDFTSLESICISTYNWDEKFLSFKTIVDNWGENIDTAKVLIRIINEDKGTYIKICAFLYFFASYKGDEKTQRRCIEMARAGGSQYNMYRVKPLRKILNNYQEYIKEVGIRSRYPGDIDRETIGIIIRDFNENNVSRY